MVVLNLGSGIHAFGFEAQAGSERPFRREPAQNASLDRKGHRGRVGLDFSNFGRQRNRQRSADVETRFDAVFEFFAGFGLCGGAEGQRQHNNGATYFSEIHLILFFKVHYSQITCTASM